MAVKKTKRTRKAAVPVEFIVRRTAFRRFNKLRQATADLPEVKLTWDRRSSDAQDGQRKTDRRQQPPFTWDTADFVVVERPRPHRRRSGSGKH
jgi:hypothetical protein